ncbi:extracellular solute-binding protein [Paenibacillus allorhizosphaerae]|uniref:HTH gntR-type domain-containing protein n=1 Tax=Paenibacillus allorhizosphaerae TaxID=2849866 RepID=A0ABM8VBD7_9BACL|nr:extracellular solute-binding protein [Paenibacillus allorhizosphaerae]CAG7619192.1 hypothetical protein PAECIP111802_00595 [Paenibacillus allorhizosphaerae]
MRRENEFRYTKLANILREQILSGYIKPGEYLLSENELCKHYSMSRTSVRKSLDQLLKDRLIVKKVGQGTVVSPDLVVPVSERKVLRVLATSPSHFADSCMQHIIDVFQQKYSHVDVKFMSFPTLDFWESIRASSDMGLQPDVIFAGDRQCLESDLGQDAFLDLQGPLEQSLQAMYPRMAGAFRQGQAVIAAPVTFSTVYLAYNPQLFDAYGVERPGPNWTRDDFVEAARKLTVDTDGDGIVDQYGFSVNSSFNRWPVIALQNGVRFDNADDKEPLIRTLTFIHDLLYRYRVATNSAKFLRNSDAFVRGKSGMVLTTSIELAGWRNDQLDFEAQVAPLPFGEEKATLLIANAFMIPSRCSDPELAVEFVRTALDPGLQESIGRSSQFLSVLRTVNEELWDKETLESLNIKDDRIENSHFLFEMIPDSSRIEELDAALGLYWAGLESANAAAERLLRKQG